MADGEQIGQTVLEDEMRTLRLVIHAQSRHQSRHQLPTGIIALAPVGHTPGETDCRSTILRTRIHRITWRNMAHLVRTDDKLPPHARNIAFKQRVKLAITRIDERLRIAEIEIRIFRSVGIMNAISLEHFRAGREALKPDTLVISMNGAGANSRNRITIRRTNGRVEHIDLVLGAFTHHQRTRPLPRTQISRRLKQATTPRPLNTIGAVPVADIGAIIAGVPFVINLGIGLVDLVHSQGPENKPALIRHSAHMHVTKGATVPDHHIVGHDREIVVDYRHCRRRIVRTNLQRISNRPPGRAIVRKHATNSHVLIQNSAGNSIHIFMIRIE